MAIKIITPSNYKSVKYPCLFEVIRDEEDIVEMEINGFLKQMSGASIEVNAAPYYVDKFTISPVKMSDEGCAVRNGEEVGRVVHARVIVENAEADALLICADKEPDADAILSDMKRRSISEGQVDEITVYVASGAHLVWYGGRVDVPAGISVVTFKAPVGIRHDFTMQLQRYDGTVLDTITYRRLPTAGKRLAWVNAYGAIDYWNFPLFYNHMLKSTKTKIYSVDGYMVTNKQVEDTFTVTTEPLPTFSIEPLCQLIYADAAWSIEGEEAIPIDIDTDSVVIYDAENLSSLKINYRDKKRKI